MSTLESKLSASITAEKPAAAAPAPAKPATPAVASKPAPAAAKPAAKPAAAPKAPAVSADDNQSPVHDPSTHPRRVWPD